MALVTKRPGGEFGETRPRGAPSVPGNPRVTLVDPGGLPFQWPGQYGNWGYGNNDGSQRQANYSTTWGGGTSSAQPGGFPGGTKPYSPKPVGTPGAPGGLPGVPGAAGPSAPGFWSTPAGKMLMEQGIKLGIPAFMQLAQGGVPGGAGAGTGTLPWGQFLNSTAIPGQAYSSLLDILMSNGQSNPAAMNQLIASTQRGAQGTAQSIQGELARRGLGNSGLGQALSGAAMASGANKIADIRANEMQRAEQQRRADLDLFLRTFVQPSLDQTALATGQYNANRQAKNDQTAAWTNLIGQVIGGIDWSKFGSGASS